MATKLYSCERGLQQKTLYVCGGAEKARKVFAGWDTRLERTKYKGRIFLDKKEPLVTSQQSTVDLNFIPELLGINQMPIVGSEY